MNRALLALVAAAMSLSTPLVRMTDGREREITEGVMEAAHAAALALKS